MVSPQPKPRVERRKRAAELGLCSSCTTAVPPAGRKHCTRCREGNRLAQRAYSQGQRRLLKAKRLRDTLYARAAMAAQLAGAPIPPIPPIVPSTNHHYLPLRQCRYPRYRKRPSRASKTVLSPSQTP